jgi:hypothetical protein
MAQLIKTSAYVRRDAKKSDANAPQQQGLEQAIWSKLKSAHTVESLARTLDSDLEGDQPAREQRIEAAMRRWLDQDLIELATDS